MKKKRLLVVLAVAVVVVLSALMATGAFAAVFSNDDFDDRTLLTGDSSSVIGSTTGFTPEANEPTPAGSINAGMSAWYEWTAPSSGQIIIDMQGSTFDTIVAVYRGGVDSTVSGWGLTQLDYGYGYASNQQAKLNFAASAGTTYYIQVDGNIYGLTTSGDFSLSWSTLSPPVNDDFADATVLSGTDGSGSIFGYNFGATGETGELPASGEMNTVWYSWTAPTDGQLSVWYEDPYPGFCVFPTAIYKAGSEAGLELVTSDLNYPTCAVEGGVTYWLQVDGEDVGTGTFTLVYSFVGLPANDNVANAQVLAADSGTVTGNNLLATAELDEPGGLGTLNTVWYKWTPLHNGTVTFDTTAGALGTVLNVYVASAEASAWNGLAPLTGAWDWVSFDARAGTVYWVQLDGAYDNRDTFSLSWSLAAAADNDDFANAATIDWATATSISGTNLNATAEGDETGGSSPLNTVWYRWDATADERVTLQMAGELDSYLCVFTGDTLDALTLLAEDDNSGGGNWSKLAFRTAAGGTYWIQVDGSGEAQGGFTLSWSTMARPANDDFADAELLSPAAGDSTTGTNVGATAEVGEYGDSTVWFRYDAPATGRLTLDTTGDLYCDLEIFTGTELADLDSLGYGYTSVTFDIVKDTTYWIQILGVNWDDEASFTLTWSLALPPSNDDFANAQTILGTSDSTTGTNVLATVEDNEPNDWMGRTVWYAWTAGANGELHLSLSNPGPGDLDTCMAVYTQDSPGVLSEKAYNDDSGDGSLSALTLYVLTDTTYYIQVGGFDSFEEGSFTLSWAFTPIEMSAPSITSADNVTFTYGDSSSTFGVTTSGYPLPALSVAPIESGTELPSDFGLQFVDNGNGTATLSGSPSSSGVHSFTITATNLKGADTQTFAVTVNRRPYVTEHPYSHDVTAGSTASFQVAVDAWPEADLQWQVKARGSSTFEDILGAIDYSYVTPATDVNMDGNQYRCRVSNTLGDTESSAALLTVHIPAGVTTQPSSVHAIPGDTATFTVGMEGHPAPSIQWQISTSAGRRWSDIAGATSATYQTPPTTTKMSGYQYRAIVKNAYNSVTSIVATLTVGPPAVDVEVTQDPGGCDPESGLITWTINVSNLMAPPAEGIVVTVNLAAGTAFNAVDLGASGATYKVGGRRVTVKLTSLSSSAGGFTFTVTANVTRATGTISNPVTVTTTSNDTNLANNSCSATVTLP